MSDFDIAKTQTGPSFLESLKRRKAFGLVESDDEDTIPIKAAKEKEPKKKKKKKSPEPTSDEEQDTIKISPSRTPSRSPSPSTTTQSNVNPYLASVIDLDNISFTPQPNPTTPASLQPTQSTQSSDNVIDLSDEEKDGDDIGIADLDPDLAALAQSVVPGSSTQPEKIVIKIQYTHNYDLSNLSEKMAKGIKFFEKPIKFKVMDNTQFRILLTNFCATKEYLNINDVYLTYNDDIVFLSGTPASVGMNSMGTHKMEIYPKGCYDKMMADKEQQKQKERMRHLSGIENEDDLYSEEDSIANPAGSSETPADVNATAEPMEERVRLSLRTANGKAIPFRVKATTTLQALVDAFRKRAEISGNVQLSFEGETMDLSQTIEETDLEDEDIVEVVTE